MIRSSRRPERDTERGSILAVILMIVLVLLGAGLVVLRQSRTELSSTGSLRASRQAYQTALSGLVKASLIAMSAPEYFHRLAVQANPNAPAYVFGSENSTTSPIGVFAIPNPFAGDSQAFATYDNERVGTLEFRAIMSSPRLGAPPPGFQVAGGQGNRFVFYTYQFDVFGWVNREPGTLQVAPGTGGARKILRADVRVGPIAVNQ